MIDDRLTGEGVLDEALKMMKVSKKMSVGTWIHLMSGKPSYSQENNQRPSNVAALNYTDYLV
jgi:hypothetical protein